MTDDMEPRRSLNDVADGLDALTDLFRRRLLEDKQRDRALSMLQEELDFARDGLRTQFLLPIVRELLLVVDRADSSGDPLAVSLAAELLEVLRRRGLEPLDVGERFDPMTQEAIGTAATDDREPGDIESVRRPGYVMSGQLVRPAQVIVATQQASGSDVQRR